MRTFLLAVVAALALARPACADAFRNLPPCHRGAALAAKLAAKGLLPGMPREPIGSKEPVSRYEMAKKLAASLEQLPAQPPRGQVQAADAEDLLQVLKEFEDELTLIGAGLEKARATIAAWPKGEDPISRRVDRFLRCDDRKLRLEGGELRLAAYDGSRSAPVLSAMVDLAARPGPRADGKLRLQAVKRQEDGRGDGLRVYEGYLDLLRPGRPFERVRAGRFNYFLGAGQVLFDRRTGLDIVASHGSQRYEAFYGGDLILSVSFPGSNGGDVGYYYIKQEADAAGERPFHVGVYARGRLGDRLDYGFEFSDYDNRIATPANFNGRTRGYLSSAELKIGSRAGVQGAAILQEEDFRALSIDHDLAFHSARHSPLEDVLQAIDSFSGGRAGSKNEINGLRDLKLGVWVKPFDDRLTLFGGLDDVGPHSSLFDTSKDAFRIWTTSATYRMGDDTTAQVRLRRLIFEQEDPRAFAGTLPIRRQDGTEVRAQLVRRF